MNRREHSHLCICTQSVTFLSKRVPPKSRLDTQFPEGFQGPRATLPPTFLFLQSSIFKEQTSQTRCRGPVAFGFGPLECRSRGSLEFLSEAAFLRSELLGRQRRTALVDEAYIVGGLFECQQRFPTFFVFFAPANENSRQRKNVSPDRAFGSESCR